MPFWHTPPQCFQWPYSFDVVTKMINVVTNSPPTPTHFALFYLGKNPDGLCLVCMRVCVCIHVYTADYLEVNDLLVHNVQYDDM